MCVIKITRDTCFYNLYLFPDSYTFETTQTKGFFPCWSLKQNRKKKEKKRRRREKKEREEKRKRIETEIEASKVAFHVKPSPFARQQPQLP